MTPDTIPPQRTPEELEAEAKIYDDHGDYLCAKDSRERAAELRKLQETQKCS